MAKIKYHNGTDWVVAGTDASAVDIVDSGELYTATNVEDALAEVKNQVATHEADMAKRAINIFKYGAIGDGGSHPISEVFPTLELAQMKYPHAIALTDEIDWCAIQMAINTELAQYSTVAYHFYIAQSHPELVIPDGTFLINKTLDITFRNDLVIGGTGIIKWVGEDDGLMIEMKCCARPIINRIFLDLNDKAGGGIHWSGDGTSDGNPTKDRLTGKGNVSVGKFRDVHMEKQLLTTLKTAFDTFPYPEDTIHSNYYSADDCEWYSPNFRWGDGTGFALSVGASTTDIYDGHFTVSNPIKLFGGSITLYSPTFSMMGNRNGGIFITKNAAISQIDVYSAYYEGSSQPYINMDAASISGNIKGIKIVGGTYSQIGEPESFISIPSTVPACITIIDPKIINSTVGGIDAPNATLKLIKSAISTSFADYQFPHFNVKNMSGEIVGYTGTYRWDKNMDLSLTVNSALSTNFVSKVFKTLDEALLYTSNVYNGSVDITLATDSAITVPIYMNTPKLRILSTTSKVVTLSAVVNIHGSLELSSVGINQTIDKPIVLWNGRVRLNTCTINATSGQSIIDAKNGQLAINNCTHNTGSIIDATDSNNVTQGTLRNNTYNSTEQVVKTSDLSKEIYVEGTTITPTTGNWAKGTKSRNLAVGAGTAYEGICVTSGTSGVWKAYSTITA
jgi:hypothetical protein